MVSSQPSSDDLDRAAQALACGQLVAIPTETVYGLAADADNASAVARIFAAKGRPTDHPLIVHVPDAASVPHYASSIPAFAQKLMQAFWPGPLTLILPRRPDVAAVSAGGHDTIGIRCPAHPDAHALLMRCRQLGVYGLAAPSANRFGRVSPTTAEHVRQEFPALHVLDGGPCRVGIESTIVDCSRGHPVILRPGMITREQVLEACEISTLVLPAPSQPAPKASGTLEAHYAPNAKVRLMDAAAMQSALDILGTPRPGKRYPRLGLYARTPLNTRTGPILQRVMPGSAQDTASELFQVLRDFDAAGVEILWVESPPAGSDWEGVRDRLQRAAASD